MAEARGSLPTGCGELARAVSFVADPQVERGFSAPAVTGGDVISCSLELRLSLEFARERGRPESPTRARRTAIFWAAANTCGQISQDEVVTGPGVAAVAQSDRNDFRVSSPCGTGLDFLAPGFRVSAPAYLAGNPGYYELAVGSSMAAPVVAGIAALMLQAAPGLTSEKVTEALAQSCDPGRGALCGGGTCRLDHNSAVTSAPWGRSSLRAGQCSRRGRKGSARRPRRRVMKRRHQSSPPPPSNTTPRTSPPPPPAPSRRSGPTAAPPPPRRPRPAAPPSGRAGSAAPRAS